MSDLISRQAAIDAMSCLIDSICEGQAVDALSEQPTIDPPKGEWEERFVECDNPFFRRRFYCSACGDWNTYGMTRYCPDCGAKMAVKE